MGATLSDADVFGSVEPAAAATPAKPKATALSDADVFGENLLSRVAAESTPWELFKRGAKDTAVRLGKGTAAAADMFLGIPGQAIGVGADIGARAAAIGAGESRKIQGQAGAAAKEQVPAAVEKFLRMSPGGLTAPLQTIIKGLGGGEEYDQSAVTKAIEHVAEGVEKKTRGYVTAEDVKSYLDAFMLSAGARGTDMAVEAAAKPKTQTGAEARGSYVEQPLAPVEKTSTPGPEAQFITTSKQVKQIFLDAKKKGTAAGGLEVTEADLTNMFAAAKEKAPPGSPPATPLATGIEKVATGLKYDVDPAEIAALKAAAKEEAPASDWSFWESGVGKKQGGAIDPQLAKEMAKIFVGTTAVAGPLAAAATYFYREYQDDKAWREWLNDPLHKTPDPEPNDSTGSTYTAMLEKGAAGLGVGAAAMGAIKPAGGNWHPNAFKLLAEKLYPKRSMLDQLPEAKRAPVFNFIKDQSDRMMKRYLEKHAGTATDPLAGMEVPFGEGVKKWGELIDKSVYDMRGKYPLQAEEAAGTVRPGESLYEFSPVRGGEPEAIRNYISHAGDFARQNISPEKLANYDFVRLMKETAANDARVAKEMEKSSAASTAQLPVYKDYGDGMKWVELKLPEKLTEEQAKGVKEMSNAEIERIVERDGENASEEAGYIAIDEKGKPIKNSYTETTATGSTPERAYLAGKLAEEGNQLGHCVGGYCDQVASGESKIYSLRDGKGKSHVTVEVEPGAVERGSVAERNASVFKDDNILQIKGKQNRAPVAAYLPYVQDFVRGGKWGEVGDLEGTGLKKHNERYVTGKELNKEIQERLADYNYQPPEATGRKHTQLDSAIEQYRNTENVHDASVLLRKIDRVLEAKDSPQPIAVRADHGFQSGSIDPKLLLRLAAVATGATVGASLTDEKLLGAIVGGVGAGAAMKLSPGRAAQAVRNAFKADDRIRINQFADAHDAGIARAARAIWQQQQDVVTAAPEKASRDAITNAIQQNRIGTLPPKDQAAARQAEQFFAAAGQQGQSAGVLNGLIDHYVTNLWDLNGKNKGVWEGILQQAGGPSMSPTTRFALKRSIQDIETGKKLGLTPLTEDVAEIMGIYGNALYRAIENKKMLTSLKAEVDPASGTKLILPSTKAPHPYVTIDHPQMNGLRVHPDIAPSMKFIFDNSDSNVVMAGLSGVNTALKRSAVSFSLFHAKALVDAEIGAHGVLKGILMAVRDLAQAAAPKIFGQNKFLQQLRSGGAGDLVDQAQVAGLKFSFEKGKLADEDVGGSFYTALRLAQEGLDSLGLPTRAVIGATAGAWYADDSVKGALIGGALGAGAVKASKAITNINHAVDTFMWERLHAGMKLGTFASKLEVLRNADAKAAAREGRAPRTEEQLAEQSASFTNDIYGGLNWRRIAEEAHTKWGRDVALAAYGPKGRKMMQLMIFAPDWTLSTTRAATRAAGELLGYDKGSGFRGLLEPQNATDLHRQYMARSAFYYALVGDGINYALSGHHLWENKDWTMIDMGDGRTMQWSKHSMEPVHWITKPGQQALNKLAFFPKELANQMLGSDYLSASGHAPRMDTSLSGRGAHVLKSMTPIAVQQSVGDKASTGGGLAGFLGVPIYGKTTEERAALKEQRKRERIRKRIEAREEK